MVGEWIAQNPGETIGIASAVLSGAGWLLVRWLGDRFEPKRPTLTPEQQRLAIEEKARAVLSTEQIALSCDVFACWQRSSTNFWTAFDAITTFSTFPKNSADW